MTQKYYAIVTNLGAAKIANAAALGTKLNITQMAVGDGGGTLPTPNASQTKLVNEVRRAAINSMSIDAANASQVIAEQVIPETEGGFWIREMGLFDADGTLIAVCNTPETYKPALQEGSGRTQTVRMILIINSTDAITLKIDPSVVLATRKYVDDSILTVRQYADKLLADHLAAENPHDQYLLTANALAEIKDADLIAELLKNLGLGEGSAVPVGVPLPCASSVPPAGWLKCNGASFSASAYPALAKVYSSLKLPDLRGEFIRGWDDGRGVDVGRELLSFQEGTWIQPNIENNSTLTAIQLGNGENLFNTAENKAVCNLPTFGSTGSRARWFIRPRNVAFNYIVRAA